MRTFGPSLSNGLNISEAIDGAVDSLVDLVRTTANSIGEDRESVEDFLAGLTLVEEELTRPDESALANPLLRCSPRCLGVNFILYHASKQVAVLIETGFSFTTFLPSHSLTPPRPTVFPTL